MSRAATRIVGAFCPCCGRTIHEKRAIKIGHVTVDHIGYFDNIEWDPKKAFGISFLPTGRGSFQDWSYIEPREAPELFQAVKGRLLEAVKEYRAKGWLTNRELAALLAMLKGGDV